MKKMLSVVALAAVIAVPASGLAAAGGSCESQASSAKVGGTKSVKLVNEYDPDWKEKGDNGVYILAVTLSKGSAYTVYIDGGNVEDIDLDVYARSETDAELDRDVYAPAAGFVTEEYNGVKAAYMTSDEWDYDDPSSWKYYIRLDGDVPGLSTTVHIEQGIHSFVELGTAENPQPLTVTDKLQQFSKALIDGEFYMTARLVAGRKYLFRTVGGTEAAPLMLDIDGPDFNLYDDSDYASDKNNSAFVVEVAESGLYKLVVSGTASFALAYQSVPARAIAAHPAKDLAIGGSASFVPGRRVATNSYFDDIIDEHLFRVSLEKGDRVVFETAGADRAVEMVAYDSKGAVLGKNSGVGSGSFDVRLGIEATAKGLYYVGVCNPALDIPDAPTGASVTISAGRVSAARGDPDEYDDRDDVAAGASGLSPLPDGASKTCVHGPHRLGRTDWADVFVIGGRKGITYNLSAAWAGAETSDLSLAVTVFTLNGTKETVVARSTIAPGDGVVSFEAGANASYYARFSVAEGAALDYPAYNVVATASSSAGGVYSLTVNTKGASGTWSLGKESVKYPGGASVLVVGAQTVKFYQVKGFSLPAAQTVTPAAGEVEKTITGIYSDTFDTKDDTPAGAAKLNIAAKTAKAARTLFAEDPADWFAFTAKEGWYYNLVLEDLEGDAQVAVYRKGDEQTALAGPADEIKAFAPGKGDFLVKVSHGNAAPLDSSYALAYDAANVGAVKFQKTAVSAKKSAGLVTLSVTRTAKGGKARVRYGTVAGTAKPGVDYVAQSGEIVWEANDNKPRQITIRLIPDLVPAAVSRQFSVCLKPVEEDLDDGEYIASVTTPEAIVTVTDTAAKGQKAPVEAKVTTENVPLETGTFSGVLEEDGAALTNGSPALASVVLSVKNAAAKALSAKVTVAGKPYAFTGDTWSDDSDDEFARAELVCPHKIGQQTFTSVLSVAVRRGVTTAAGAHLAALAECRLDMNVPDANNKGLQEGIAYAGSLYRDNSKIQGYLTEVLGAVGYYTVALVPAGAPWAYDAPAGNGYLTVTIDNKGKAKVAGALADGATKPTYSSSAAVMADGTVKVPVFVSKASACFGGTLVLKKSDGVYVVDSTSYLKWNNDDPALTYWGEEGWRLEVEPVGGYFNALVNLQAYYKTCAFGILTADISEFPVESLAAGYSYVAEAQPNEMAVDVNGNAISTPRKNMVKAGKYNDLVASVNPCNVQVRLTRATGLVSGTFSVWTENGVAQKELTGLKHQGILLLSRDESASIDPFTMSAGFFTLKTALKSGAKTRSWTMSLPFNLMAVDQGEPDWYADDWGERPEE